ncbi:MAG: alpha-L-rhamnosidase C-terminal domain-containing protein, partial [bacterium]
FNGGGGGPWWGAALVLVTRDLWLHTADQRAVATHYVGCRAWVTYLQSRTDADGLVVNEEPGSWCLGDWILPGEPAPLPGTTALEPALVNTACLAVCARQVAAFARLLGQPAEATALDAVAAAAATALHRRFYDPVRACYAHGRNGAEAFAWAAGAIPPAEQPRVLERLLAHYTARHWRFDTGIIGTPLLLEMFAAWGRADLGWRFLRGTDYPSFGYMFANDATTLWECWEKETGSHCHPMFGAVCAWIIREVAGLRPDPAHPGWREFQVHLPCLPNLDAAAATVPTPHGEAHAAWRRREGGHHLRLSVPPGCTAWLTPPTGGPAIRCGGGDHEFAFPAANGPAQLG